MVTDEEVLLNKYEFPEWKREYLEDELFDRAYRKLEGKDDYEELRKVLDIPPDQRDERGDINDLKVIWEYVPKEIWGFTVSDEQAKNALRAAILNAVVGIAFTTYPTAFKKSDISDTPIDGYRQIIIILDGDIKDFPVPDVLKNYPGFKLKDINEAA